MRAGRGCVIAFESCFDRLHLESVKKVEASVGRGKRE